MNQYSAQQSSHQSAQQSAQQRTRTVYDQHSQPVEPTRNLMSQRQLDSSYYVNQNCGQLNSGAPEQQRVPALAQQPLDFQPLYGNRENRKEVPLFGGNWSRTKYDQGSLEVDTRQATSGLEYTLDPNYAERCNQSRAPGPGWLGKQGVSYDTSIPIVDTESELFNLNRVLTRDPNYQYIPYCPGCGSNCSDGYPCGQGVIGGSECQKCQKPLYHFPSSDLKFEYTRLSNPICTIKETGVNRFQPIALNPQDQDRWEHPGETGINYRMIVKDNHVPCIPYPIDPAPGLPRGGSIGCELVTQTCNAFIGPMHSYYK
jgi:hypothetical protein